MPFEAWENTALGYHKDPKYNHGMLMDNAAIKADCADKMERYDVRPPNPRLPARNFSGGNQQKIVVAREMDRAPDILLVGQPTRGVDIGAIEFIPQGNPAAAATRARRSCLVSVELDEIHGAQRPHRRDVRRQDHGRTPCRPRPTRTELGLLMAGVTETRVGGAA